MWNLWNVSLISNILYASFHVAFPVFENLLRVFELRMKAFEFYSSVSIYDLYVHNIVPFGRPYESLPLLMLIFQFSSYLFYSI